MSLHPRPLLVALAGLALAAVPAAFAQVSPPPTPTCIPTGLSSGTVLAAGSALAPGSFREYRCTVVAGKTYDLVLNYTGTGQTPNDIGNYVGLKLYKDVGGQVSFLTNSAPNGFRRETVTRTPLSNETWYLKIENLATGSGYDTTAGVDAVLPGGGEGP